MSMWKQHLKHQLKPDKRFSTASSFHRREWKGSSKALLSLPVPDTNHLKVNHEQKNGENAYLNQKRNCVFLLKI